MSVGEIFHNRVSGTAERHGVVRCGAFARETLMAQMMRIAPSALEFRVPGRDRMFELFAGRREELPMRLERSAPSSTIRVAERLLLSLKLSRSFALANLLHAAHHRIDDPRDELRPGDAPLGHPR